MTKIKTIYISGKVTGIEAQAKELFDDIEQRLISEGYGVVNPMSLRHDHDKSWQSYMRECLDALLKCDAIYVLPNYKQSQGAMIELQLASTLGMEVIYASKINYTTTLTPNTLQL